MNMLRILAVGLALAVTPAAYAAAEIRGVDGGAFPEIRLSVVTSRPTAKPPTLAENGEPVAGLVAENLGRAKSVVLAVDRSQSMRGQPLADAIAAARAFIAAKPREDRIAIATFATQPVLLTSFSTATIDSDTALRSVSIDPVRGTTFYDALVLSAHALAGEPLAARVIIAVTDGNETRSHASLDGAIEAAREAGASVYVVAIESANFTPEPLKKLAAETGGSYYGAASSEALAGVYESIANELRRTWQLEYVTAARPGEEVALEAKAGPESAQADFRVPGTTPVPARREPSPLFPRVVFESSWGAFAVGGSVALMILLAAAFSFASPRGAWLKHRISPHLGAEVTGAAKHGGSRERFAAAAGLFRATEKTFGHFKLWQHLQRTLDRADVPLRTVEFVYVMGASALLVGLVAAAAGPPTLMLVAALAAGASLPYGYVSFKARRRLKAFESQLPDLLTTIAASLKAGHSFRQGIQAVVEEGVEPSSQEFKRVLAETRLGRPMDAALAEMSRRVGSKNLEFVLTAVTIQRQVGGSLAGIFDMVAETVRNRHQFARKVKGLTAMGRASAYVLIALPFFVAGAITLINSEYMSPLWHTSTGHKMLFTMFGMMGIGSMILRKIVSFKG
jgi:tight adherence protein B